MSVAPTETAVAFVVREKFSWALASLRRLYAIAGAPFTLYLVDSVYPPEVRAELDAYLADKNNVVRIDVDRFLYPVEALNLVIERLAEPYLWLVQNDVLVSRNSLAYLLETAKALGCDVVAPVTLDMESGAPAIHRHTDRPVGIFEENGNVYLQRAWTPEVREGRTRVLHLEMHSMLMTAETARAVHPLPPLNSREHVDLAMQLWRGGKSAFLDERVQALYMGSPPMPLRDFDCNYFRFRWDLARARQSHEYVQGKWRIADLPTAMRFVEEQHRALLPEAVQRRYGSVSEPDPWEFELAFRQGAGPPSAASMRSIMLRRAASRSWPT